LQAESTVGVGEHARRALLGEGDAAARQVFGETEIATALCLLYLVTDLAELAASPASSSSAATVARGSTALAAAASGPQRGQRQRRRQQHRAKHQTRSHPFIDLAQAEFAAYHSHCIAGEDIRCCSGCAIAGARPALA